MNISQPTIVTYAVRFYLKRR
uniref:Uncharacterized protein n=1 Tax=Tetranychus urticae TaxID=32264 RepID=T1K477_TETUR